jgi:glycosyltransferase involved in cell wall biosynthesis
MVKLFHICYVEAGYPHHHGGGGGAGTYVQLVGHELARRGHRVSVVAAPCNQCPFYRIDKGVHVYRPSYHRSLHWYAQKLPGGSAGSLAIRYLEYGWGIARFLARLHREIPINLVEYSEGGDFWSAFRSSFPYVVHLHGSRFTFLRQSGHTTKRGDWYHRRLELWFLKRARYVVSPSYAILDVTAGELGYMPKYAQVLPYPIDPRLLCYEASYKADSGSKQMVLFAARNDPVKGANTLLSAVPLIREYCSQVEFHLFGYTPLEARLPADVYCHPFVAKEELLANYHRAAICVVPSRWDNSPNTVYEAMAAGKAVIASRVGGIPELVEDGETGILVDPDDPAQLANALVELLRERDRSAAMGRKGRERIQKMAGLTDNVSRRVDMYCQVITELASPSARQNHAHRSR